MCIRDSLDFQNFKLLMVRRFNRVEMRRHAKFGRNRSNRGGDMTILRFFKMAAAAILDFQNFKLLMVRRLKRVEMHRHAKFGQNVKMRRRYDGFFDFSRWRPPPSCIFKFLKFQWSNSSRGSKCAAVPNLVEIGQNVA